MLSEGNVYWRSDRGECYTQKLPPESIMG